VDIRGETKIRESGNSLDLQLDRDVYNVTLSRRVPCNPQKGTLTLLQSVINLASSLPLIFASDLLQGHHLTNTIMKDAKRHDEMMYHQHLYHLGKKKQQQQRMAYGL
jgi:hypothetical protein